MNVISVALQTLASQKKEALRWYNATGQDPNVGEVITSEPRLSDVAGKWVVFFLGGKLTLV